MDLIFSPDTSIFVTLFATGIGYLSLREWGIGWGITCCVLAFLIGWLILGLILRKLVMNRQEIIQKIMMDAQEKVNRQLVIFERRPPSSMNAAREILEKIQFAAIRKSLEELENFKKYYAWNMMLHKQVSTMKIQLYYQLREYDKVDALLPDAILMDPQSMGIKLARMYKNNDPGLDKFYKRKCWKFRGETGAFVACVYGWIKSKQNQPELALEALKKARKYSDHEVLVANIEALSNGRNFSNSGFGDTWYALALEEPKAAKAPKMKKQRGGRPF